MKIILKENFYWIEKEEIGTEISEPIEANSKFKKNTPYEVVGKHKTPYFLGGEVYIIVNERGFSMSVSTDEHFCTVVE